MLMQYVGNFILIYMENLQHQICYEKALMAAWSVPVWCRPAKPNLRIELHLVR
jgi:hypothetical protein